MVKTLALHFTVISDMKSVIRDMKRFEDRLRQIQRQTRFVSTNLEVMNRQLIIGLGLIAGFAGFITKKAVGGAVIFEDAQNALEVFIGDAEIAKAVLSDLMDFAATTPFEIPEVLQGAKTLMALGVRADQVVPKLKTLGEAAFALKKPLDQVTLAWNRLQQGIFTTMTMAPLGFGRDTARKYGVEFGAAGGMATPGKQAADAFETYLIDQFGGMFDKAKTMLSGKIANLVDEGIKSFAELGLAITPIVKEVLDDLIDLVGRVGTFFQENQRTIINALEPVTEVVKNLMGTMRTFMTDLENNPKILSSLISKIITLVKWMGRLLIIGVVGKALSDTIILVLQLRLMIVQLLSWIQKAILLWTVFVKGAGSLNAALALMKVRSLAALTAFGPWVALLAGLGLIIKSVSDGFRDLQEQADMFRDEFLTLMDTIKSSSDKYSAFAGAIRMNVKAAVQEGLGLQMTIKSMNDLYESYANEIDALGIIRDITSGEWMDANGKLIKSYEQLYGILNSQESLKAKESFTDLSDAAFDAYKKQEEAILGVTTFQKVVKGAGALFNLFTPFADKTKVSEWRKNINQYSADMEAVLGLEKKFSKEMDQRTLKFELVKQAQKDMVTTTGKASDAQKLYNKFLKNMVELGDKWNSIQSSLRIGLIDAEEAAERTNKLLKSAADSGLNLYSELARLSPALAALIESDLANLINIAKVSNTIKEFMEERVKTAKKQLEHDLNEIEFKNALLNIGEDQEQIFLNELDMIADKLKRLENVKDIETDIQELKYEQLLTEKRLAEFTAKRLRDKQREQMFDEFASQQRVMEYGFALGAIGMDRRSPREQLKQEQSNIRERLRLNKEQQAILKSKSAYGQEQLRGGVGPMTGALVGLQEKKKELDEAMGKSVVEMQDLTKEFYESLEAAVAEGVGNLISSLSSGDIGSAFKQFFKTMGQVMTKWIQEQTTGLGTFASGAVAGLAGLGLGLIMNAFNKSSSAALEEVNKVFVVNWPKLEAYTLPQSLMFSGRGGDININITGTTAGEHPERIGERVASSLQRVLDRGINIAK